MDMLSMYKILKIPNYLLNARYGQSALEYSLILLLISIVAIVVMPSLGVQIADFYELVTKNI